MNWKQELKRQTAVRKAKGRKARTGIPAQSAYRDDVVEWAYQWNRCWRCGEYGVWPATLVIHHFLMGAHRYKQDQRTTSILCQGCHEREHTQDSLGLLGFMFLKQRIDPDFYDLDAINTLRGRAETALTQEEIDAWGCQQGSKPESGLTYLASLPGGIQSGSAGSRRKRVLKKTRRSKPAPWTDARRDRRRALYYHTLRASTPTGEQSSSTDGRES